MKLAYTLAAFAATALAANATSVFTEDFESYGHNDASHGWTTTGSAVIWNGATAGNVLISVAGDSSFTAFKSIGATVAADTTYTLTLDGGTFTSDTARNSDLTWELGTVNGGVFTAFSTAASTNIVGGTHNFDTGNEITLTDYTFTTGAVVGTDDVAIRLTSTAQAGVPYGGFDDINVDATTAVPEPSSAALLGLGGLALILRRRK